MTTFELPEPDHTCCRKHVNMWTDCGIRSMMHFGLLYISALKGLWNQSTTVHTVSYWLSHDRMYTVHCMILIILKAFWRLIKCKGICKNLEKQKRKLRHPVETSFKCFRWKQLNREYGYAIQIIRAAEDLVFDRKKTVVCGKSTCSHWSKRIQWTRKFKENVCSCHWLCTTSKYGQVCMNTQIHVKCF